MVVKLKWACGRGERANGDSWKVADRQNIFSLVPEAPGRFAGVKDTKGDKEHSPNESS